MLEDRHRESTGHMPQGESFISFASNLKVMQGSIAAPDLQKASSMGSAEPNFVLLIFRQICLVFRKIISSACAKYQ